MNTNKIGVYDSGVGGLTVLAELVKNLPNEDIIYLGDTARMPYGTKSKENIIKFSKECVNFLVQKEVKAIVVACGTVSGLALDELKKLYNIPIIGVIEPTVDNLSVTEQETIGVIATKGTIHSNAWEMQIHKLYPQVTVINRACQVLVQIAEEGWTDNDVAKSVIKEYMKDFKNIYVNKLILGCTHFPLFKNLIQEELKDTEIVNTGEAVSIALKKILEGNEIQNDSNHEGNCEYYLTDDSENFKNISKQLLKTTIAIKQVNVGNQ